MTFKKSALLWTLCLPTLAWAYGPSSSDDSETKHLLSVGAGIASPSVTTSISQNPAGLVFNSETKVLGALASQDSNLNTIGASGLVFLGNGTVGGGLGVQTYNNSGTNGGSSALLDYGIAAYIPDLRISFGAAGTFDLRGSGGLGAWGLNVGMIYNPKSDLRFGVSTFNVLNNVGAIGVGIAADPTDFATFTVDASTTPQGTGKTVKPAMGIHLNDFQLTIGYGARLDDDSSSYIRRGAAFGLGVRISSMFHLQAYYNDIAPYYVAFMIRL